MPDSHDKPVPLKCTSCQRPMDSPVCCQDCHTLYPVGTSEDHFKLFGLPRRYALDLDDLHQRFLSISRNIHPDFFGAQAAEMQALSLRLSAQVNEAYATLKDPVLRAEYLLESTGGKSSAKDKSVPGELLAEVMLMREAIEDARAAADSETLAARRAEIEARQAATLEKVAALCGRLDEQSENVQTELRQHLNAMRYLGNLLATL
ncbi:MAG: Fe-S protein assembly co-chaperone HscB [Phycisphaerae bacterium]|nr:Fe-S protein assembly co-chaperone HscB [Phycisphaerae bacterium]